jgi:hypothetical protein
MAINERLIDTAVSGCSAEPVKEGLILHLDASDVDSYDGDGDEWVDITDHEYTPTTNVSEHFNTVIYDGQNTDLSVTGVGFTPDLVWIKCRDVTTNHHLSDSVRGGTYTIFPNLTNGESSSPSIETIDTDGFTVFGDRSAANRANQEYVAWCFKAGGVPSGSDTVSIDGTSYADESAAGLSAGNVAVTKLSANTELGFSIATLDNVATSPNKTFSHGLGVAPEMVIGKIYDGAATDNWHVMLPSLGANNEMFLNTTDDTQAWSGFNNTAPDSNVVNLSWTTSTTYKMVFYSFASKTGVSKVGSYTGTQGAINIDTGFEPAFVMIKWTSGSIGYGGWNIYDNKRDTTSPNSKFLQADSDTSELDYATYSITMTGTGFTVGASQNDAINFNGNNYIYYAVAKGNETDLIPDTDLELHLDAASFDGSTNTPSTWTDSSGNSNNGTITNATFDAELGNWLEFGLMLIVALHLI